MAAAILQKAALPFEKIDAEENAELVRQYNVMQAPTLVVVDGEQIQLHTNASDIRRYAETVGTQMGVGAH